MKRNSPFKSQRKFINVWLGLLGMSLAVLLASLIPTSVYAAEGTPYATGFTRVRGQAWLPGPTGVADGNLWVSDSLHGFCRVDPTGDGTRGILNQSTCVIEAAAPGQFAFDELRNLVYVPSTAAGSAQVVRYAYNRTTRTVSTPTVINLAGGGSDLRPVSAAIGPDGNLYAGFGQSGQIFRVLGAHTGTQTLDVIATTAGGSGIMAMAFVGNDLYIAEEGGISAIASAVTCTSGNPCTAVMEAGVSTSVVLSLAASGTDLYIGASLGVYRYDTTNDTEVLFGNVGSFFDVDTGTVINIPLVSITSMAVVDTTLYLADDPTGGNNIQARLWHMDTTDPPGGDPAPALTVATIFAEADEAGITVPANLIWLDGALGERLWASDADGFCRIDPGIGNFVLNANTCRLTPGGRAPTQVAVDPAGNFLYFPSRREGVFRVPYNPATNLTENPILIKLENDTTRVASTVLGPDGHLYIGYIRTNGIVRYINPSGDPNGPAPEFYTIGAVNVAAEATAFVGHDLYVVDEDPEAVNFIPQLVVIRNATACGGSPTVPGTCVAELVTDVTLTGEHIALGSDGESLFFTGDNELFRYDPLTGQVEVIARSGLNRFGADIVFGDLAGLGFDAQGALYVADDSSRNEADFLTHIWKVERPIANAGVDQVVLVDSLVTLNGAASFDPNNNVPIQYEWQQVGTPVVDLTGTDTAHPTFTAPSTPTELTFRLRIIDTLGMVSKFDTVQVTVGDVPITGLALDGTTPTRLGDPTAFTATTTAGTNIVYTWDFGDGSPVVVGSSTAVHAYDAAAGYMALVTATNGAGSAVAVKSIEVVNAAPLANAGPDQTVVVGAQVTLNGGGSSDPDGHLPLSYLWTQTGGPAVTLNNNTAAAPAFTAPGAPTSLTFSLAVTDNRGAVSTTADEVVIDVRDSAITNAALSSSSPTTLGHTTFLTATATGSNLTYLWDMGDGSPPIAGGATVAHVFPNASMFNPSVTIANAFDSVVRTTPVNITNLQPLAHAGEDQTVYVSTAVTLTAAGSSDPDGHLPLSYTWQQTSGPAVTLQNPTSASPHFTAPSTPQTLVFAVAVTDARGRVSAGPDSVTVQVVDVPITNLTAVNSSPALVGQSVAFEANALGSNIVWQWSFGDGATGSGRTPSRSYSSAGVFTAIVTATNSANSVSESMSVAIGSLPPVAHAGQDQTVVVGETVALNGSGSTDPGNLVPLLYRWTQAGGPAVVLSSDAIAQPTFTAPPTPAVLTFQLRVTNTVGLPSVVDEVVIEVEDIAIGDLTIQGDLETILGQPTNLSASASGTNITYAWGLGDGVQATGQNVAHTYGAADAYTVIVTATNSTGSVSDSVLIAVNNLTPVASAGADFVGVAGSPVSLDGSGSFDPDGHTPLLYHWTQTGGPAVALDDPAAAQPGFTAPSSPVVLTFSLVVTDAMGLASATDTVEVVIKDGAPTDLVVNNDGPTVLGQTTTLNAAADGTNLTFTWTVGEGAVVKSGTSITHAYATAGIFNATVTVSNSEGSISANTTVIVINNSPVAHAGPDQNVLVGANVTLDGSASSDPDGHTPLTYSWVQSAGTPVALTNADKAQASFTAPPTPGALTFRLTVTDSYGQASIADAVSIFVGDGSVGELAIQLANPTVLGQVTALSASAPGSNLTYTWDLGDGNTATGATVNHTYAAAGAYIVKVTASNQAGSQEATASVLVSNQPPTVNTGGNQSVSVNTQVVLDGSASSDPDGHTPLSFEWVQTGGTPVTLADANGATTTFTAPPTSGALIFVLTVTDAYGLASSGQVIVNVGAVPISDLQITSNSPTELGAATILVANAIGSGITYEWTLGDNSAPKSGAQIQHTYARAGTYTVIVVATNELGAATATAQVAVVHPKPVVLAGTFNPEPPEDSSVYTLTLQGLNFVPGAIGYWNDQPRPTQVISATEVVITLTPVDVAQESVVARDVDTGPNTASASVHVVNPAPGGGSSERIAVIYLIEPPTEVTSEFTLYIPQLTD